MRKGQNPAKFVKEVAKPERITAAVLNYIPFLSGFYAEALDVLKASLDSMRNEPGLPFDLMVFDNGSCPEVRDYLVAEKEAGRIQYLILSEKNMGKGGAWNVILAGAPGEIIAYADSDILYYPGWLSRSVELLETFPNVGMVTGPIRSFTHPRASGRRKTPRSKKVASSPGKSSGSSTARSGRMKPKTARCMQRQKIIVCHCERVFPSERSNLLSNRRLPRRRSSGSP
jgi:cellulose synthase/poly-beta-1,6-N-acetylglucosamine synthase-like glycosyltransferase